MGESTSTAATIPVSAAAAGAALRSKLARHRSRIAASISPPPPLPLISLPPDDEFEEFNTPTRSGFHYELPHVDLANGEFEDTSVPLYSESTAIGTGSGRRKRDPAPLTSAHERVKICRLLSAYMTQNESFQTQRHGFGIDTRLVYKRNKGTDVPASAAAAAAGSSGIESGDDLAFNALFESGNLDRAYRVNGRHYASSGELLGAAVHSAPPPVSQPPFAFFVKTDLEYDLYCDVDVNTHGHIQWYFFRAMLPVATRQQSTNGRLKVRFNIRNMLKRASLYNDGMLPAVYIESPVSLQRGWHHAGSNVCYFKNADTYRNSKTGKVQNYYTLSFVYEFDFGCVGAANAAADSTSCAAPSAPAMVVYFAHCYPYTYTRLQQFLLSLQRDSERSQHVKRRVLCKTIAGNNCDLLTITDFSQEDAPEQPYATKRTGIFLTARVHPGESNSSFVMHGILDFLTGNSLEARFLRHNFVFKVVPMLNPDGVVHGNYRCSLAGTDLNRRWMHPSAALHPTILATKNAILSMKSTRPVSLYCDIHGHSRKKNIFLYGCKPFEPTSRTEAARLRLFPHLLAKTSSSQRGGFYSYSDCTFSVSSSKKGTGRVVIWKEAEVLHSFTLEASFFGVGSNKQQQQQQFDQAAMTGPEGGTNLSLKHFTAFDLRTAGSKFCAALLPFAQVINLDRAAAHAGVQAQLRAEAALRESTSRSPALSASESASDTAAFSPRSPGNKVLLAPLHPIAPTPGSRRAEDEDPTTPEVLISPNQLERRSPSSQPFCEQRTAPEFASPRALPSPLSSLPSGFSSTEFDGLFAGDSLVALLSLSDPEDLLKEIEAALPDGLADCGEEDGSIGSESDPSGDNMEDEELQSASTWRSILPLPAESSTAEPISKPQRARPLRLVRHLSEPRL